MNHIYNFVHPFTIHAIKRPIYHEGQIIYELWNMLLKYGAENRIKKSEIGEIKRTTELWDQWLFWLYEFERPDCETCYLAGDCFENGIEEPCTLFWDSSFVTLSMIYANMGKED